MRHVRLCATLERVAVWMLFVCLDEGKVGVGAQEMPSCSPCLALAGQPSHSALASSWPATHGCLWCTCSDYAVRSE